MIAIRSTVLTVLQVQVYNRPNPKVELGAVDTSCPIVLCDLEEHDDPIVYATDAFYHMTGYTPHEVLGRNCRFLQAPGGKAKPSRKHVDDKTVRRMRKALDKKSEIQIEVVNYKKNGQAFVNFLTMIPLRISGRNYCVGFQCEME